MEISEGDDKDDSRRHERIENNIKRRERGEEDGGRK